MLDAVTQLATLAGKVDWLGVLFIFLVSAFFIRLMQYEKKKKTFILADFVTDATGRADKYGLGYVLVLLVMTWAMWYLAVHDRLTEWYVTLYVGAFVIGSVSKSWIASNERQSLMGTDDKTLTQKSVSTNEVTTAVATDGHQ